jgi:glycosyltransferase involved in cell wall biosynthesis
MLMARALELRKVDRVIALKFPAYLVRHPQKTIWLLHQFRQAYDLYGTEYSNLGADAIGRSVRRLVMAADAEGFAECRRIFTNSEVTRRRLAFYNSVGADVLLPPVNDAALFTGGPSDGYIFAGGRINLMKRQHLLVEALARTSPDVKLLIAGPPDSPEDAARLERAVEAAGVAGRVSLDLRFVPRPTLAGYVNRAAAVAYLPYDEDSLGYVAMEAATASKALISTTDSGGVLTLARHLQTGWVARPDADSLADVMSQATSSSSRTRTLGLAARDAWHELGITWPATLAKLLS